MNPRAISIMPVLAVTVVACAGGTTPPGGRIHEPAPRATQFDEAAATGKAIAADLGCEDLTDEDHIRLDRTLKKDPRWKYYSGGSAVGAAKTWQVIEAKRVTTPWGAEKGEHYLAVALENANGERATDLRYYSGSQMAGSFYENPAVVGFGSRPSQNELVAVQEFARSCLATEAGAP